MKNLEDREFVRSVLRDPNKSSSKHKLLTALGLQSFKLTKGRRNQLKRTLTYINNMHRNGAYAISLNSNVDRVLLIFAPKLLCTEQGQILSKTSKLGLGIESKVKIPRIKSEEVIIDLNTELKSETSKSILYAAGFSMHQDDIET